MKTQWWARLTTLALLVAVLLTGVGLAAMPASAQPGLARAIAAQQAHTDALLARAGVIGTAVGRAADGSFIVKIYTESARVAGLPRQLDGVPVDIEVTGEIVAQTHTLTRPSPIGVSTGTERLIIYRGRRYCTVGTLGARVTDGTNVYALSNAHVYALEGSEPDGTVVAGQGGDRVLQPGRVDMNAQACGSQHEIDTAVVGNLWSYVPIVISRNAENKVDAAIALVSKEQVGTATPVGGYGAPSSITVDATVGLPVQKYGRTTGLTTGTVTGINATVIVRYDTGRARFIEQVVITGSAGSFSDGGDSGSLIVTQSGNHPVALLFAGSSSTTIGNPIADVLASFGVPLTVDAGVTP